MISHEVGVAVGVRLVELQQDVDRSVGGGGIELRRLDPRATVGLGEPVDGVHVDARDGIGVLVGDLLDLDTTLSREHPEVQLRGAVERERRVVLLGDVARLLDPHHVDAVTLDVHPEDVRRVGADLVDVGRELDSPGLPSTPHEHLGLHDDGVAHVFRDGNGFVDGRDRRAGRDRDAVAREQLLALVLE